MSLQNTNSLKKRMLQTSLPHDSYYDAQQAAEKIMEYDVCDYVYITEDLRVVSICRYDEAASTSKRLKSGMKRVLVLSN